VAQDIGGGGWQTGKIWKEAIKATISLFHAEGDYGITWTRI